LPEEIFLLYPVLALSHPCFSETAEDIRMKFGRWVEGNICQTGFLKFFDILKVKVTVAIFVLKL
jgi:hypothetical protein